MLLGRDLPRFARHHEKRDHEPQQKQREYKTLPAQTDGHGDLFRQIPEAVRRILLLHACKDIRLPGLLFDRFVSGDHTFFQTEAVDLFCRVTHVLFLEFADQQSGDQSQRGQADRIVVYIIEGPDQRDAFQEAGKEKACAQTVQRAPQKDLCIDPPADLFHERNDVLFSGDPVFHDVTTFIEFFFFLLRTRYPCSGSILQAARR